MPRNLLPKGYIKNSPTLRYDFSNTSGWVVDSGVSVSTDVDKVIEGASSTKLTFTTSGKATITFPTLITFNNNAPVFHLRFYLHEDWGPNVQSMTVYTSSDPNSNMTNQKYSWHPMYAYGRAGVRQGWNTFTFSPRTAQGKFYSDNWADGLAKLQFVVTPLSGKTVNITLDSLWTEGDGIPKLLITFDDGWATAYQNALPYMNQKGIRATMYTVPSFVGQPGYMTLAQLKEMQDAGWCIANHTYNHLHYLDDGLTVQQGGDEAERAAEWLINNGFKDGAYHLAYPYGQYDTGLTNKLKELGFYTARAITPGEAPRWDLQRPYELPCYRGLIQNTTLLSDLFSYVDKIIASGTTGIFCFHKIPLDDTGDTWAYSLSKFQQFIDYVVERKIECLTIDEWYQGLWNPRRKVR